ncbi:MAG: DNA repair protein [Planctomycetes bacterium]|nr:DNA repair protein [Planctomycetota bacterium]
MKRAILIFVDIKITPSQVHKFRGFIGNLFKDYDLVHNHYPETGKNIYRYPLIQFKLLESNPAIIAVTDQPIEIFMEIFLNLNQINIDKLSIPVNEKDIHITDCCFGYSEDTFMYSFISPWIGLNQKNHKIYMESPDRKEKHKLLQRALCGNILSMAKGLGYWLTPDQRIRMELQVREKKVLLKGKSMLGFKGLFKTNFMIPDYMGLGKSVSRGFGTVRRII